MEENRDNIFFLITTRKEYALYANASKTLVVNIDKYGIDPTIDVRCLDDEDIESDLGLEFFSQTEDTVKQTLKLYR